MRDRRARVVVAISRGTPLPTNAASPESSPVRPVYRRLRSVSVSCTPAAAAARR